MSVSASHLSSLYNHDPVCLWVEDEETRSYLNTVWGDGQIGILVAGGVENVRVAVHAARKDGVDKVFGFRDRDFGVSNVDRWMPPGPMEVFVGDALEVESYLLDATAIAGCTVNTAGRTAHDIEAEMERLAGELVWWMSCRKTIASIRDDVVGDFLPHPKRTVVRSLQDAEGAILAASWWTTRLPVIASKVTEARVRKDLGDNHAHYDAMLRAGGWRTGFSAKEIFEQLLGWVYTKRRPPDPAGRLDFVKAIARAQVDLGRVPREAVDLRVALRSRVGI